MTETIRINPGYEYLVADHGLSDFEAVFNWDRGRRLDKAGMEPWRQRWRITLPDTEKATKTFYLKRFEHPPFRRQVERWRKSGFRLSTAGIEWTNAMLLNRMSINSAEPVVFGQQMRGPWEVRSFLLMREVSGESLERWVPTHLPPADQETNPKRRREYFLRLAQFVARFHEAGFVHRDLYLSHIFFRPELADSGSGDEAARMFCLIDLQRVFRPRRRRRRWVVKDLAALNYSTPTDRVGQWERLRFLCQYTRAGRRFGSARMLARLIGARTSRMMRRHGPPPRVNVLASSSVTG